MPAPNFIRRWIGPGPHLSLDGSAAQQRRGGAPPSHGRGAKGSGFRQPRRAASILATSIFFIVIIASNARLASAPPAAIASVSDARRDLPGDAPFVLAPAALAFLAAVADDRVPVAVGLLLVVGGDLEREGLAVLERGAAVEADAGNAGNGELDRQHVALLAGRVVARRAVDGADRAVRERSWRRSGPPPRRPCRTRGRSCSWLSKSWPSNFLSLRCETHVPIYIRSLS